MRNDSSFWRSEQGRAAWSRLLDNHMRANFALADRATLQGFHTSDYLVFEVTEDAMIVVSKGWSHFILKRASGDCCVRAEYAMTVPKNVPVEHVVSCIEEVADRALEAGVSFGPGSIVENAGALSAIGNVTVGHLYIKLGLWLTKNECHIDSYFPAFFLEITPITEAERLIIIDDPNVFLELCDNGGLDVMNFQR